MKHHRVRVSARLTSVFILFLVYLGALRFQKFPVESAPNSIRAGPIDIPIRHVKAVCFIFLDDLSINYLLPQPTIIK